MQDPLDFREGADLDFSCQELQLAREQPCVVGSDADSRFPRDLLFERFEVRSSLPARAPPSPERREELRLRDLPRTEVEQTPGRQAVEFFPRHSACALPAYALRAGDAGGQGEADPENP